MPRKSGSSPKRASYHHGDLRNALVDAAIRLVTEESVEAVTVRRVAKMAGVSPGAPFRHFASRTALLTAVAEKAIALLRSEIRSALTEAAAVDGLERFRVIGLAFLRWAARHPAAFVVISDRRLIDFEGSETLRRTNAEIQAEVESVIAEAQRSGLIRQGDVAEIQLTARALVYGLARMCVDGQFPSWGLEAQQIEQVGARVIDCFLSGLAGAGRPLTRPRAR
jgi:AcrR family transcriptional regulator